MAIAHPLSKHGCALLHLPNLKLNSGHEIMGPDLRMQFGLSLVFLMFDFSFLCRISNLAVTKFPHSLLL